MAIPRVPGTDLAPRNVYCIGRNYAEHARELGNPVPPTAGAPVVFLKPTSCLTHREPIRLPALPATGARVDHEVELVALIGRAARDVTEARALEHVWGYGVGIDVTARDLQEAAKAKGLPWAVAKGFDSFAPLGEFAPAAGAGDPAGLALELAVNGARRQHGATAEMIFTVPRLIAYLSSVFTLAPGDLIFTGTPSGVGPLAGGDRVEAELRRGDVVLSRLAVGVSPRAAG